MADHRFFHPYVYDAAYTDTPRSIGSLMGVTVPVNVAHVDIWATKGKIVWRNKGSGKFHEMEWPADGDVMPVIVAMRISC